MVGDISKIYDAFAPKSVKPVEYKGKGDFMRLLHELFGEAQQRMQPVKGMGEGIFTINPGPQPTKNSLHITDVSPDKSAG